MRSHTPPRSRIATAALALLMAAPALLATQQPAASGRGQLAGIVVEDGSSPERPVRRSIVTLTGTGLAVPLQVLTDDAGRFAFSNLSPGRFSLTAEKAAYLKTHYGSTRIGRPPGMPIAIAAGENQAALRVPLMRGAAIGGLVREITGQPVAGAQVQVSLVTIANGGRKLVSPFAGTTLAVTNDLGEYRVWGLPPGEYVLRVVGGGAPGSGNARTATPVEIAAAQQNLSGSGALPAAAQPLLAPTPPPQTSRLPTYAPGVIDPAQAMGVTVSAGDERTGIDIVSLIGPVGAVAGTAIGPGGEPVQNISVGLVNLSTQSLSYSAGFLRPNAGGTFGVGGLAPGRWLFFGRGAPTATPGDGLYPWWAETEFTVGEGGTVNVVLQFAPGSVVTGRLEFRGAAAPPDLTKLRVSLQYIPPVDGMSAFVQPVVPAADGSFTFPAVPPAGTARRCHRQVRGRYRRPKRRIATFSIHRSRSPPVKAHLSC